MAGRSTTGDGLMPAESNLYAAVRRYLDWKRQSEPLEYRKVHGSPMQQRGEPDLDICYHGRSVKIELKAPGKRATPLQLHRLQKWAAAGAVVGVARSVDDVASILAEVTRSLTTGSGEAYVWTQEEKERA